MRFNPVWNIVSRVLIILFLVSVYVPAFFAKNMGLSAAENAKWMTIFLVVGLTTLGACLYWLLSGWVVTNPYRMMIVMVAAFLDTVVSGSFVWGVISKNGTLFNDLVGMPSHVVMAVIAVMSIHEVFYLKKHLELTPA